MSYATEAAKRSRYAFTIIQIDLDNTISPGGAEYHCNGRSPLGELIYSTIPENGFDPTPTRMAPGVGLGFLGSVKCSFNDFRYGERGTYFGKLLAANPYYLDRPLRVFTGFYDGVTFDWTNFKEKLYFIKRIDGPDSKGRVVITADDILTLLDDDQAQITSAPDAKLAGALTNVATGTLNISDNTGFSSGGGIAQINDEFLAYSGVSGGASIVVTARAQFGTTAAAHEADDPVIPCYSYSGDNVVDVIYDLIDTYSPIAVATYIDLSAWEDERDNYMIGDLVTGIIPAGTAIKEKINELCTQTMMSCWWDDEAQLIRIKAVGPTITPAAEINTDTHILNKGETIQRDPSKAITAVAVWFGRRDHAADAEAPKNYAQLYVTPDAAAAAGHGKDKIKTIFAADIPESGTSTINKMAARMLSQLRIGQTTYKFQLDVRDAELIVGDLVQATTSLVQDENGDATPNSYLVVERDQIAPATFAYTALATGFLTTSGYRTIAPDSLSGTAYSAASAGQRELYGFIADTSTVEFSNSDPAHLIL